MADEIKRVVVAAGLLGQLIEEHAFGGQLFEDRHFLLGVVPDGEETVEGGVGLEDRFARAVFERFGNEAAARVEVLHALGGDADFDGVDVVADRAATGLRRR